jgi:hypothetical protein
MRRRRCKACSLNKNALKHQLPVETMTTPQQDMSAINSTTPSCTCVCGSFSHLASNVTSDLLPMYGRGGLT